MHASMAFLNGAGSQRPGTGPGTARELVLLNTLLTVARVEAAAGKGSNRGKDGPSVDKGKSKDERKAEEESEEPTFSRPGGFKNQPDDPTNPNEARERVRRKLTP
jgi:hypothetical protein